MWMFSQYSNDEKKSNKLDPEWKEKLVQKMYPNVQ